MNASKIIKINGVNLNYFDSGKGKVLLFLHGALVNAHAFHREITVLSKHFRVIAIDLPGHGKSGNPKANWEFENYAELIKIFLNELHISDYYIVGHSFGGGIAARLALNNPQVKKLVLVSSTGIQITESTKEFLYNFFVKKVVKESVLKLDKRVIFTQLRSASQTILRHSLFLVPIILSIKRSLRAKTPELSQIKCLTLILWGDRDEVISPRYAGLFKTQIPKSELKIFPGNHSWCMFQSELFCNEVIKFLKD